MQADPTTISDLSIFHHDEEQSVFHLIDFTTTTVGRHALRHLLERPFKDISKIIETQQVLKLIIEKEMLLPPTITNGTIMVIEKFYDSAIDEIPHHPYLFNVFFYKLASAQDFSLIKYTVKHFVDFFKGLQQIITQLLNESSPTLLKAIIERIKALLERPLIKEMIENKNQHLPSDTVLTFARYIRHEFKDETLELIDIYSRLDAYYSMAVACKNLGFTLPVITQTNQPFLEVKGLYHPMLSKPVSYNGTLNPQSHFLFLTGANMAGKSTFIKAVGIAVYLAHVGMGVPAESMNLSLFDGLLSNIQVEDDISRGESYFFNEVQRIKKTVEKINDGRLWLILIDELFKGTNVQDAMRCSTTVIEGLLKMKNALFILSTHLYEISDRLRQFPNIKFSYFETGIKNGQLQFSYALREGVSNDRLGYLILQNEGVVDMLSKL